MNNRLHNKHSVFGRIGDFWYRQLSEDAVNGASLARTITHLLDASHAISDLEITASKLAGTTTNYKNNHTLAFNPMDVQIVNLDFQKRNDDSTRPVKYSIPHTGALQVDSLPDVGVTGATAGSPSLMLGDSDAYTLWNPLSDQDINVSFTNDQARPMYYVPIPLLISPICITTKNRELTVGTSFITNNGYILFYENPVDLFPDNVIFCRSSIVKESHTLDYTYQTDNLYSSGIYVARYMRATHSPVALRLALAEVAGLPIIHEDSILTAIYQDEDNIIYEFDTQVLEVPLYIDHITLTVGTTYSAGTIIGEDYIKIYSSANTDAEPSWYRHEDLEAIWDDTGLSLSTLTPFSTISVPDATGTFSTNGVQEGSTAHLMLSGVTGGDTAGYWAFVRQSEIHTNRYMASISGATAAATTNLIDFYFDNMLTYNAVIIKLRTQELGSERHQNVMSFIRRDLPINVTPIIV